MTWGWEFPPPLTSLLIYERTSFSLRKHGLTISLGNSRPSPVISTRVNTALSGKTNSIFIIAGSCVKILYLAEHATLNIFSPWHKRDTHGVRLFDTFVDAGFDPPPPSLCFRGFRWRFCRGRGFASSHRRVTIMKLTIP